MAKSVKFFQRSIYFILSIFLIGCSTVEIPGYIKAENPYKRSLNASYDVTLDAVLNMLAEKGWTVKEQSLPSIYEESYAGNNPSVKQVLIITEVKKRSFFVWKNYFQMNVFLSSSLDEETDVEVRYLKVKRIPFKSFYKYKKAKLVNQMLNRIAELAQQPQPQTK